MKRTLVPTTAAGDSRTWTALRIEWDSFSDYVTGWKSLYCSKYGDSTSANWIGNNTAKDNTTFAGDLIRDGAQDLVEFIDKKLDDIESKIELERENDPEWTLDVAGAFPCVPTYLSGLPENMRQLTRVESREVVTVYISTDSSASVEGDDFASRGAAICALVRILQRYYPVEVKLFSGGKIMDKSKADGAEDYGNVIPLDSAPLSLPHLAAMLCKVATARQIEYGIGHAVGYMGQWAGFSVRDNYGKDGKTDNTRHFLGAKPTDIIVNGIHRDDPAAKEPVKWLVSQLIGQGIICKVKG